MSIQPADLVDILAHARALGTIDPIKVKVVRQCWCGSPVVGRGLCNMHYLREWRRGFAE